MVDPEAFMNNVLPRTVVFRMEFASFVPLLKSKTNPT